MTVIFVLMKNLQCPFLPDWEYPRFFDWLASPPLPVLVFICAFIWIDYVMLMWQISPEMSVAQYDKHLFLTLTKFDTGWAIFQRLPADTWGSELLPSCGSTTIGSFMSGWEDEGESRSFKNQAWMWCTSFVPISHWPELKSPDPNRTAWIVFKSIVL